MIFTETKLKGAYIIDVKRIEDDRGFFARTFCQREFNEHGLKTNIVQSNVSYNKRRATLRGLHIQLTPYEETKLVRCCRGSIYDVIVDLRKDSETCKQWIGAQLTSSNYKMLYIPAGFAHAFITLEDDTEVEYQVSEFYTPSAEKGFRWNDPSFNIIWPIEPQLISEKDQAHPFFKPELPKPSSLKE